MRREVTIIGVRKLDGQGGMEKHVREVSVRLARRGWRVTVLESAPDCTPLPGVFTANIDPRRIRGPEKLAYNLRCAWRLVRHPPPLVYIAGLNAGLLLWLYRLCGMRVVARLGSVDFLYPKFSLPERVVLRWCLLNFRLAHRVVVVNRSYLRYLAVGPGTARVIGNGTDGRTEPMTDHDLLQRYGIQHKRFILSVGRITPEKGYATLMEAFASLGDCGYTLVIAGGGATDILPMAGRGETVKMLGEVPAALMRYLYVSCACYVNASLHEGQSNAALEAMSFEVPVLLSDIDGNRSLGLPERNYFPPRDQKALAGKLFRALQRPQSYVVAPSLLARFDWETVCDELERTFMEAVHG